MSTLIYIFLSSAVGLQWQCLTVQVKFDGFAVVSQTAAASLRFHIFLVAEFREYCCILSVSPHSIHGYKDMVSAEI